MKLERRGLSAFRMHTSRRRMCAAPFVSLFLSVLWREGEGGAMVWCCVEPTEQRGNEGEQRKGRKERRTTRTNLLDLN